MSRAHPLHIILSILALFLVGTVVVLSSVSWYLAIDPSAYLTELEIPFIDNTTRWNAVDYGAEERIPRIIHQTWKTDVLPDRWKGISQACRDMMPDYEYMLWTDASSRDFIVEHYPWFLETFDNYKYNIQRADAIRYFVLHYYGGVYMDLDIGCLRPVDQLLVYPVVLPRTIPVGISNDLMFAEKGHPLLLQAIHSLSSFDYSWILNYPTVMFSTGPMFISAQYGIYASAHPGSGVRILPKSLYGKNAKEGEAPHSFFLHYYGSSWHADDAAFVGFLGTWGKLLMWVGLFVLMWGLLKLSTKRRRYNFRRISSYEILFPRWSSRTGRWHWSPISPSSSSSPSNSVPSSPLETEEPHLHAPFDTSPINDDITIRDTSSSPLVETFRGVRSRLSALTGGRDEPPRTPIRTRRHRTMGGVFFFLPAIFTQPQEMEMEAHTRPRPQHLLQTPFSADKRRFDDDLESGESSRTPSESDTLVDHFGTSTMNSFDSSYAVDLRSTPPRPRSRSSRAGSPLPSDHTSRS